VKSDIRVRNGCQGDGDSDDDGDTDGDGDQAGNTDRADEIRLLGFKVTRNHL